MTMPFRWLASIMLTGVIAITAAILSR